VNVLQISLYRSMDNGTREKLLGELTLKDFGLLLTQARYHQRFEAKLRYVVSPAICDGSVLD
jgi:hypothetical protein